MSNKLLKIAISGKSGCGNSTVSNLVSERFGVKRINYTFHDIAKEKGLDFHVFCQMVEKDKQWDLYLDQRQLELADKESCVLSSRLAIWLLKDADLRVYLQASPRVRALRIQQREGGSLDRILAETMERDLRDHNRYLKLYGIDNDRFIFADLIINTELFNPSAVCQIITDAVTAIENRT